MSKRSLGLGRGLDALISGSAGGDGQELTTDVPATMISPNRFQPRQVFDEEALEELAQSIRLHGVVQPLIVRKIVNGYELVAGERRWRAARMAGLKSLPAVIRDYNDAEVTEIALIENLQREDLNPIEEATAYKRLMEEFSLTQEEVARKIGRSRPHIANLLRLLNLAPQIQEYVSRETLTMGQVRPLLALPDHDEQLKMAKVIIDKDLTARAVEEMVKGGVNAPKEKKEEDRPRGELVMRAEQQLNVRLGVPVKIAQGKRKSKIVIEYTNEDDFARIMSMLAPDGQD